MCELYTQKQSVKNTFTQQVSYIKKEHILVKNKEQKTIKKERLVE